MKCFDRVAALCASQYGLCTRRQLLELGVTRHEIDGAVARGILVPVQPRVYAIGGAPGTPERALLAACLSSGAVASHRSASRLWGLPTPGPVRLEILVVGTHRPRLTDTIVHRTDRLDRADCTVRNGIPTTALARTVLDLGAVLRPWDVELAMEDAVLRLGTSIRALRDCLDRMGARGRSGCGVLRAILDWRDPAMAAPEGALNLALQRVFRRHHLPPWIPELRLHGPDGERVRLDFAWPDVKLGIEGDSRRWHAGRLDVQRNARKANTLVNLGWSVYHYTWVDVRYRPGALAGEVRRFLTRAAA